ncbi:MAG: DUF72 domain-containing protein [Myxococcales bacterium]
MDPLHLGTSGFVYKHWKGLLYEEKLPARRWLERYCQVFSTVELNTTFYRLPKPEAVDRWREESPAGFVFACKGSRFLTHMKRLTDTTVGVARYFDVVLRLGDKLGPILWQLPPQMTKPDPERLRRFLRAMPEGTRHVVEFRSAAWYTDEICDVLDEAGAAFCEHDLVAARPPRFTGGFRYLRFHGASGKYHGRYGREGLEPWARDLKAWRRRGREAFVYFNNDLHGHALYDALVLSELLGVEAPCELPALDAGHRSHPSSSPPLNR